MGLQIGPLYVRRSIFINAGLERVWQEFETFERIKQWFGVGHRLHELTPSVGGRVDISIENEPGENVGVDGRSHMVGSVLVLEPQREISFQTKWKANEDAIPSLWTLKLTPIYEGTLVEIFQHGMEQAGEKAADWLEGNEEGWDVRHLKALRKIIEK